MLRRKEQRGSPTTWWDWFTGYGDWSWPVEKYTVETEPNSWSYIVSADGYCSGPIRYRWEAQEWADEMNAKESSTITEA